MLRSHRILVLSLAAALASAACGSGSGSTAPATSGPPSGSPSAAPSAALASPIALAPPASAWDRIPDIVAHVGPSVVSILRPDAEGSGVVWSEDGVIVTNNHVVEGVKQVVVVFLDGQRSDAEVLATDPLSDLAIVKAQRTGLPAAQFATAIPPQGSLAIAVGNPLGFENSATAGIISGSHRAIPGAAQDAPALVDLVQTDAAISPGNSGGALIGADEQVIGVNVAYIPPSAGSVSIGFAIPAPTVIDVVKQLQANGRAEHPYLGVQAIRLTPDLIQRFDIKATDGALVVAVAKGSPAAAAGIKPGDVIVGLGDVTVHTVEDMLGALRQHKPGDTVQLKINRDGTETVVDVTLGEIPR
jgi:S1-C subfamily serine protease